MGVLFIGGLLLVNVLISWWNCYVVGHSWDIVKKSGSTFDKMVLWSGAIQAGVGFSMPILVILALVSTAWLASGQNPQLTQAQADAFIRGVFSLWYLLVIIPILGTGFIIWVHSIQQAVRRRDFSSIATAGWNTYANAQNFLDAGSGISDAFSGLGKLFGKSSSDDEEGSSGIIIVILVMLVVVALLGGAVITAMLIQRYRRLAYIATAQAA